MKAKMIITFGTLLLISGRAMADEPPAVEPAQVIVDEYVTPTDDPSDHAETVRAWLLARQPVDLFSDERVTITYYDDTIFVYDLANAETYVGEVTMDGHGRVTTEIEDVGRGWIDVVDDIIVGYFEDSNGTNPQMWGAPEEATYANTRMKLTCGCWGAQRQGGHTTIACGEDDCGTDPKNCGVFDSSTVACSIGGVGLPPGLLAMLLPPIAVLLIRSRRALTGTAT